MPPAEAELLEDAGAQRLDEDVRAPDEALDDRAPFGRFMSTARLRLLRLTLMKVALSWPQYGGAHARASSPRPAAPP